MIDHNCDYNYQTNTKFVRSAIPLFYSTWIPIARWFALFLLTGFRMVRYSAIYKNDQEKKICITLVSLASAISILMISSNFGVHIKGGRLVMMVYLMIYNESLRLNVNRLIKILIECLELIFLYFTLLLVLSVFFRYALYNEPLKVIRGFGQDETIWFLWDFTSFPRAFMTELITDQGRNLPTVFVVLMFGSKWKGLLYFINIYFCKYWIFGILRGTVLNTYRSFYTDSMLSLLTNQRGLYNIIVISFNEFQRNVPRPMVYKIVKKYW